MAGSRRDREDPRPTPTPRARRERPATAVAVDDAPRPRRGAALPVALLVLVIAAAAVAGLLLWQRLHPSSVQASVLTAARENVELLYAYDYRDSKRSVEGKLAVLTGDLHDQYERDLSGGGIIDTYEQVSATTRYEITDIGLKQVNEAQDVATLVVFGSYVIDSVTSGDKDAPEGSGCEVTPAGAQSCSQTVRLRMEKVDGDWKISDLTLL